MELVEVNGLHAQRAKRSFELLAHIRGGEVFGAVHELFEVMAELGGDDPARAVVAAEVIADQALGEVVAVAFGGVDEVDAQFGGLVEDGVHLGLGEVAAPFAAELPGADADDGHSQARAAKKSIAHGANLAHPPTCMKAILKQQLILAFLVLAANLPALAETNLAATSSAEGTRGMKWIAFPDARLEVRGLPWLEENLPELWRLPKGAKDKVPKAVWNRGVAPDGGRIRLTCNSTRLGIRAQTVHEHTKPCFFDAYVNGQYAGSGRTWERKRWTWCYSRIKTVH